MIFEAKMSSFALHGGVFGFIPQPSGGLGGRARVFG
jgi:hypothetical protein